MSSADQSFRETDAVVWKRATSWQNSLLIKVQTILFLQKFGTHFGVGILSATTIEVATMARKCNITLSLEVTQTLPSFSPAPSFASMPLSLLSDFRHVKDWI